METHVVLQNSTEQKLCELAVILQEKFCRNTETSRYGDTCTIDAVEAENYQCIY